MPARPHRRRRSRTSWASQPAPSFRAWRFLPLLLAVVPFGALLALIIRYAVDVPYWDQWNFVPTLARSYDGSLSLADLWAQHNEHRILVPRLIMLALAHATHWNVSYELATNVVFALGIFAALVWLVRAQAAGEGRPWAWLVPALSLVVFSLGQWENWLWGWQICVFLNVLAVTAGVAVLGGGPRRWRLPLGITLGAIASYSFACGLAYWAAALPVLLVCSPRDRRGRAWEGAIWIVAAGAILASYLYHYRTPAWHPPITVVLARPLDFTRYVLDYLGRPVADRQALFAGVVGLLAVLGASLWLAHAPGQDRFRLLAPYLSLSLYALLGAAMTGIGRLGFGVDQALTPRYTTVSNLLWISALVLLARAASARPPSARGKAPRWSRPTAATALTLLLLALTAASSRALPNFAAEYAVRSRARTELLEPARTAVPDAIYSSKRQKGELLVLRRLHLSVFRTDHP